MDLQLLTITIDSRQGLFSGKFAAKAQITYKAS